jgi:predicted RNA-binding protein with PUA domain
MTRPDWSVHGLGESPAGKGPGRKRSVSIGGRTLQRGDQVKVTRPGWHGRVGEYLGFDENRKLLKVAFVENGGAILLVNRNEILLVN